MWMFLIHFTVTNNSNGLTLNTILYVPCPLTRLSFKSLVNQEVAITHYKAPLHHKLQSTSASAIHFPFSLSHSEYSTHPSPVAEMSSKSLSCSSFSSLSSLSGSVNLIQSLANSHSSSILLAFAVLAFQHTHAGLFYRR